MIIICHRPLNYLLRIPIASEQPVHKAEIEVDTDSAHAETIEQPVVTEQPVAANEPVHQTSEVRLSSQNRSAPRPKPAPTVNLSGTYSSAVTYTKNELGVDEHSYFGELPKLQVNLQQVGIEIAGSFEGSRNGRIKGTLNGYEINFAFNLIDSAGNTHQGKGTWFVARDGEKMIGRWALVNASDGSEFLEGDWKLSKLR